MKKHTICTAAIDTLKTNGKAMRANEIYDFIIKNHLYQFKAKEPLSILKSELRKHSEGIELAGKSGNKYFVFQKDKTYSLKDNPSQK